MTNLNKKRTVNNCPLAEARFDPDKSVGIDTEVRYPPGRILDTSIGILLSNIGFSHKRIHPLVSTRPILDKSNANDKQKIRVIQRSQYAASHILDRQDISSISRMMCSMRYRCPDGTGFPPLNENKYLHEFVRLYQIIDFYTEMTNPVLSSVPFSRMDVLGFMRANSGPYEYNPERFSEQPKFDASTTK